MTSKQSRLSIKLLAIVVFCIMALITIATAVHAEEHAETPHHDCSICLFNHDLNSGDHSLPSLSFFLLTQDKPTLLISSFTLHLFSSNQLSRAPPQLR